jgi:sulfur carrier protein
VNPSIRYNAGSLLVGIVVEIRRFRPVNVIVNGQEKQLEPGTTVAELLTKLEVSPRQVAVEVNQELVPRRQHAEHALQSGDRLEIVGFVGGG